MEQWSQAVRSYDAIETLLKSVLPEGCRIFQANMPLQLMGQLEREASVLCTYMFFRDKQRQTSSGVSPVHDVTVEFSFYGSLSEVDSMAAGLADLLIGNEVSAGGWRFILQPGANGKRDVWEPRIQVKRLWIQYQGIMIEPPAATGTAG